MTFANLHMHTFFSDGVMSPEELMENVYSIDGLKYFALTDHDTLSGIEPIFRIKRRYETELNYQEKMFVPGIEMSLREYDTGLSVHLIGLFPGMNEKNLKAELKRIDHILGGFCRYRCNNRAAPDLDSRIRHAFSINLDNIKDHYESAEDVILILRKKAGDKNLSLSRSQDKDNDLINYPIPVTYQVIIDHWEELLPGSSREKITLYILRPDKKRVNDLAKIYVSEGMDESEADKLAKEMQGVLARFERILVEEVNTLDGLSLLKKTGAITVLAHPAVDHFKVSYDDFDRKILYPMIDKGLDGIEVFYPYDMKYREEAINRYLGTAEETGLLVSGGTDFHGDGRTRLDEMPLDIMYVKKMLASQ